MNATTQHPFHREIGEVEAALARGSCAQALAERIAGLQGWLDGAVRVGELSEHLHGLLAGHVEALRRALGTGEAELILSALANLDEAATLLRAADPPAAHA